MSLTCRQKITVLALVLYWPMIFILTHIPVERIPRWLLQAKITDKMAHYLAYLALVFLLWFALSPYKKVNWRKLTVWWVLLVIVWYGVFDEWLQGIVGRNADIHDFAADLLGALTGLVLLTIFPFWPASLILTGGCIFILVNFMQASMANYLPITDTVFYLGAYGFFTLLWIRYMLYLLPARAPQARWLIGAPALPVLFLIAVELFSVATGNELDFSRIVASLCGVCAMVLIYFITSLVRSRIIRLRTQKAQYA
jgi:hypothetical protein